MSSCIAKRRNQVTEVINEDVTPKEKTKNSSPFVQKCWGSNWGCYMPRQDKSNAKPPCWKKSNKNDNQPSGTRIIGGVVTLNDKAAEAKPSCQSNFKKEFVRLPYKTKNNMYCFQVLP